MRTEIRLQFSRYSLLYAGKRKASHCFIQEFVATNFSEPTKSQTEYIITAILLDSIISMITALNSWINAPVLCTPIKRTQSMFLVAE